MDEPLFMAVRGRDPEFIETIVKAQETLAEFRELLRSSEAAGWFPCIKTRLSSGEDTAFIWLMVEGQTEDGFVASVFEIPKQFAGYKVDDRLTVPNSEIMDWMLNQSGTLRGGYSLRYQRSKLPPESRDSFDEHIGVTNYG